MRLGVRFLARRDRTVAQVERFLASKGASPLQVRQTVRRLSDLTYLDDHAYAQRWVNNRLAVRPMGEERLRAELQAKGISKALAALVTAEALREIDERGLARRVIQAAERHHPRLTSSQLVRLLHRRGFSQETIDRMIENDGLREEPVYDE